jgi:shikimate kinase
VGLSGAGKSTAGERAAKLAEMRFVDLDAEIVRRVGRSIPEIFEKEGEQGFRRIETEVTQRVLAGPAAVIAAGGGWIASAGNRALLPSHARTIYLRVGVNTAAARLGENHGRPKLAAGATIEILLRLEAERAAFYELADGSIDTEDLTLQQVTMKLADLIKVFREE